MRVTSCAVLSFLAVSLATGATPEERTLLDQGIPTDGPSLTEFFRSQVPSARDLSKWNEAVARLGDRSFRTRESASRCLTAAGRSALPLLSRAADSTDLEVSRRARRAMDEIERVSHVWLMTSAARVLAERRPPHAADALLGYLPIVRDEAIEAAVREALAVVGLEKGEPVPAVLTALSDRDARVRAAAAFTVGRSAAPSASRLSPLLRDSDPEVRLLVAEALLRGRDGSGVAALTALIEDAPESVARRTEDILFRLAGESAPDAALVGLDVKDRRRAAETWRKWWAARGAAGQDVLSRFASGEPHLGVTLYCLYDSVSGDGRVILSGPDGKTRFEIDGLSGPNDARLLPGNRVLIAERNAGRVTERDSSGKVLWERRVESGALSAQRLPGGNTLIATWNKVLESSPDGKTVWEYEHPGGFRHASWSNSGLVLAVTSGGQLLELDRTGKLLRSVTPKKYASGAAYWASVEMLPSGRYLAALGSSRHVVEVDSAGMLLWEMEAPSAVHAVRLPNGNTLISSFEECEVVEVDRAGKEIARKKLPGRPFCVRRY